MSSLKNVAKMNQKIILGRLKIEKVSFTNS